MSNKRAHSDGRVLRSRAARQSRCAARNSQKPRTFSAQTAAIRTSDPQTKLRARLKTAEETLRAIQSGEVDALMVSGRRGEQVVSLKGGEPAYRMLVEAMSEGAATLVAGWRGALLQSQVCGNDVQAARENYRNCGAIAGCGNRAGQI